MKTIIAKILDRDLKKLAEEISAYGDVTTVWKTEQGIHNSAGNLCLHICGNLRHFIGAVLGGDGYVRNRDGEFSTKDMQKEQLIGEIEITRRSVAEALEKLNPEALKQNYPLPVGGEIYTTEFFLVHLIAHLNYHLGQINYHRRLIR